MTRCFVPAERRLPPAVATTDVVVEAPPAVPRRSPSLLPRLVPVVAMAAALAAMAVAFSSGAAGARNPMFLAFPIMMLASTAVTVVTGRGSRRGRGMDTDRLDYLGYLSGLRHAVAETAAAQRFSLLWNHPDPDTLWTLIGGPRMWERQASDPDFCLVRIGVGTEPLATRLLAAEPPYGQLWDPVTAAALRRFVDAHSTIAEAPVTVGLRGAGTVTVDGDPTAARGLLRALVCQLAVLHPPDQLLIAGAVSERRQAHWDWLKWLPHNRHPAATDAAGAARMVYRSLTEARGALADTGTPHSVIVTDVDEDARPAPERPITGATILRVGNAGDRTALTLDVAGEVRPVPRPDRLDLLDTVICARRLAGYRAGGAVRDGGWPDLAGLGGIADFDPAALWRRQVHRDRLRVPLGTDVDGAPLELDIKEPAEGGMGPHGLCVGATGSGKSELLRTIALGMMARNSPEALNLLLIDFKGGATFLDLARAPHVASVITNLAEEAPLVARMHDALAGEMHRRQQLLRQARCAGIADYRRVRRAGGLPPLPTLFIVVDEFSELISQHPDFADMFVAIGRLGRSLGVHLLLASQRLDEGRLRGLEAHLSYRICLKTLSAGESRAALGTPDAYHLPNTPGAGFLRCSNGEPVRFHAAFVSGPVRAPTAPCAPAATATSITPFAARATGPLTRAADAGAPPPPTALQAVLDRLAGHGPPAHPVWLPPLGAPPELGALLGDGSSAPADLVVPIGIVDRPFEQCRTPLIIDLSGAAGNVAVVGAPRSGKSTALRTLVTALAATHDARRVQFYCLDFGGGELGAVGYLPHVGAVAGRAEPELVRRTVSEIESIVRSREARRPDEPPAHVFLVVDGWASLRQEFDALEAPITALAAQGLSFGVHVVLSASRWAEIRPSLKDQVGTRIELRLGDPADSEIDRKRARQVPHGRPGRGLSPEGLHMLIARPVDDIVRGEAVAPPIPLLPARVDLDAVANGAGGAGILLGLEERRLAPVAVDFERHSHLLILGGNQCGKTATLRTLCRSIVRTKTAARARLFVVDFRRTLLGAIEPESVGDHAMSPAALGASLPRLLDVLRGRMPPSDVTPEQLRARSWWSGPDVYIVVDDYDLVATPAGNPLAAIAEYLPFAGDLGLHLVVARRSGGVERALFEPLLAGLRDLGCLTLMMSRRADEGPPLGPGLPARLPPGRGVLITPAGDQQLVHVAWTPPP